MVGSTRKIEYSHAPTSTVDTYQYHLLRTDMLGRHAGQEKHDGMCLQVRQLKVGVIKNLFISLLYLLKLIVLPNLTILVCYR